MRLNRQQARYRGDSFQPGQTGTCVMPGGICPYTLTGHYWVGDANGYSMLMAPQNGCAAIACCWNLKADIVDDYGGCTFQMQ